MLAAAEKLVFTSMLAGFAVLGLQVTMQADVATMLSLILMPVVWSALHHHDLYILQGIKRSYAYECITHYILRRIGNLAVLHMNHSDSVWHHLAMFILSNLAGHQEP